MSACPNPYCQSGGVESGQDSDGHTLWRACQCCCEHNWKSENDSSDVEPSRPYCRCTKCGAEKEYEPPTGPDDE